jgi:hypothetical protein
MFGRQSYDNWIFSIANPMVIEVFSIAMHNGGSPSVMKIFPMSILMDMMDASG